MTFKHSFDTCNCIIEYKDNLKGQLPSNYLRTIRTCKTHAMFSGQALAQKVLDDNMKINVKYFPKGTVTDSIKDETKLLKLKKEKAEMKMLSKIQ